MKHPRNDYNERIQDAQRRIPNDEPVFLLRAQDELAADTVDFWADAAESHGVDPEVVQRVREHADRMRRWPRHKLPDTPLEEMLGDDEFDLSRVESDAFDVIDPETNEADDLLKD